MHPLAAIWPPARLRIVTPRLELRLPTEAEIVELYELARRGIHGPDTMPFAMPWSEQAPDTLAARAYAWHMQTRASWAPDRWQLLLAVFQEGRVVGAQDVSGSEFGLLREIDTGSWLGREFHGSGLGTEMRQAVLEFAFAGLGATAAHSGAYEDNPASIRVSEKCGYVRNGVRAVVRRRGPAAPGGESAEAALDVRFRLERSVWEQRRRSDIEILGLDRQALEWFGVSPD